MNKHQLTYIDMHPQAIKTRYTWRDISLAVVIGLALAALLMHSLDVL